jgi:EAL domain-containing protein (putative c-di-GMP-specific phosphodiesterase class I)/GGDEF domain-containing protein
MRARSAEGREYYHLRAEWLRFKNHVFDASTDLPTLAAVLDDVRRLVEERGKLGLVYLDLGGDGHIETVHGWQAYDELIRAFAEALRCLRSEGLLASRDLLATLGVRSDKFLLFVGGGRNSTLDHASLAALAGAIRDRLAATLAAGAFPAPGSPVVFHAGHSLLCRDPMLRTERIVHRALDEAMLMSFEQRSRDDDRRAQGLDAIIQGRSVVTLYQPILDLRDLSVLGHEVFTRGAPGSPLEDPEQLFAIAERAGRLVDFERVCRSRALESVRRHLKQGAKLFLNTSAHTLRDPEVAGAGFVRQVDVQSLDHGDVVLEISERVTLEDRQAVREVLASLKREGFRVAIDDMGAGYASLQALVEMEPDYLKFDISLVHHIDRNLIKRSLLETLVDLSVKIGAQVIAEGIELESELRTLREMGVGLGQGHYLAPPSIVSTEGP